MNPIDPFHPPNFLMERFCRQSNLIEEVEEGIKKLGDDGSLHPADIGVIREVIALAASKKPLTKDILLGLHRKLGSYLMKGWVGQYRTGIVTVGKYLPPDPGLVPYIMDNLYLDWEEMDAYTVYIRFEKVHPFQDLNGRIGRFLYLWKRLQEGFRWKHDFGNDLMYQVLQHSR